MSLLADGFPDLPADAIGVLILLLLSFFSWLKGRFFSKSRPQPEFDEADPMREVIWRRQVGELLEPEPPPLPAPGSPQPARPAPPGLPASPPPLTAPAAELSPREEELARAFEHRGRRRRGADSPHRRRLNALLRSPHAARDAIVVREVLGPPLALRSPRDE